MKYLYLILIWFISGALAAQTTLPPEMVLVEGGTFTMGCTPEQVPDCLSDESPSRIVRLPSFEIGKYEVTQAQWQAVMGNNPSGYSSCGGSCPVEQVSYNDGVAFCNRLSQQQGLEQVYYFDQYYLSPIDSLSWNYNYYEIHVNPNANGYRLPTEAEWEYAVRGGHTAGMQSKYSGSNNIGEVGWYSGNNTPSGTKPVGQKLPNALGIYDMSGNVWEWCFDEYIKYGSSASCNNFYGYTSLRGGSYNRNATYCRVSNRSFSYNYYYFSQEVTIGLRIARNAD